MDMNIPFYGKINYQNDQKMFKIQDIFNTHSVTSQCSFFVFNFKISPVVLQAKYDTCVPCQFRSRADDVFAGLSRDSIAPSELSSSMAPPPPPRSTSPRFLEGCCHHFFVDGICNNSGTYLSPN